MHLFSNVPFYSQIKGQGWKVDFLPCFVILILYYFVENSLLYINSVILSCMQILSFLTLISIFSFLCSVLFSSVFNSLLKLKMIIHFLNALVSIEKDWISTFIFRKFFSVFLPLHAFFLIIFNRKIGLSLLTFIMHYTFALILPIFPRNFLFCIIKQYKMKQSLGQTAMAVRDKRQMPDHSLHSELFSQIHLSCFMQHI